MATFLARALMLDPIAPTPNDPAWFTTPQPVGLGARTVVVSPGGSPALSDALADARPGDIIELTAGVHTHTGGNLVITGGADAARLGDPFFQALLPVEGLTASATTIASGLRPYDLTVSEPTPVIVGVPKPGARVVAEEDGVPLVVRERYTGRRWAFQCQAQ